MSSRGTVTEDTFSTYGFTYLIDKISRECGQAKTSFIKKKWPVFPIAPTPTPKNMNVNSAIAAITDSLAPKLRAKTVDQSSFRIKSIQQQLNRVGCNVGVADGVIGEKTRSGLYRFTMAVQIEYDVGLLKDENFLELVKNYPLNTCSNVSTSTNSNTQKRSSPITATRSNSAELQRLQQERQMLATNLQAMQQMMDQQERMANAAYNSCFSRCALNNRAGSGIMGALSGMAQCNMSCAPLKYGGAEMPPSWERDKRRYQRVDCMITRMSKNQATASCKQY
jgi:hypothetical protein